MFLKDAKSGDLVEVIDTKQLFDPNSVMIPVRYQAGEELPDIVEAEKSGFNFPSGESLPKCWLDPHYRINF